ncbi:MAG: ORF6N domain-containing protein [Bacteroidetes bacterium]|nr:ORF6N domain-containing protein [Bacteroidota bacterium]MBU1484505.1 ORF6N domain-containing protein [Bacteroidota bacterium]MBU2375193.1 ORF6N domain-containing protein [Bacteroidota bacterium]
MSKTKQAVIPTDDVSLNQIYVIRKQKVMLDREWADLYAVETRVLKQVVRRNIDRFPEDFMFELTTTSPRVIRRGLPVMCTILNLPVNKMKVTTNRFLTLFGMTVTTNRFLITFGMTGCATVTSPTPRHLER